MARSACCRKPADGLAKLRTTNIRAQPEPAKLYSVGRQLEPVKLYSVGTLFRPFVGIEGGIVGGKTNFDTNPPFSVNDTGGVFGVFGGLQVPIAGTPSAVGVKLGWLGGNTAGTTSNPAASRDFAYSTSLSNAWEVSAFYEHYWNPAWRTSLFGNYSSISYGSGTNALLDALKSGASVGVTSVSTSVKATSGGLNFNDTFTRTGFVASVWVGAQVSQDFALTGQLKYIYVPTQVINVPGAVNVDGSRVIGTIGLTWYPDIRPPAPLAPQ
jgi:hypothetical protein